MKRGAKIAVMLILALVLQGVPNMLPQQPQVIVENVTGQESPPGEGKEIAMPQPGSMGLVQAYAAPTTPGAIDTPPANTDTPTPDPGTPTPDPTGTPVVTVTPPPVLTPAPGVTWGEVKFYFIGGGRGTERNKRKNPTHKKNTTTKKFLVMFHKDLKIYSYAGGHCEEGDTNPLERAIIELKEETGVQNFSLISKNPNKHIPFDIDIHFIEYNPRVNMAEHYHYDFRYLFVVDNEFDVKIDEEEMSSYKWIGKNELSKDVNFGKIVEKIEPLLKTVK